MRVRRDEFLGFLFLLLLLPACAGPGEFPRVEPVEVPVEDATALAGATNAFAFDLWRGLPANDANRFLSPFSIHAALAMTSDGAMGETAGEIRRVLHLDLPADRVDRAYQSLFADLGRVLPDSDQEFSIANAVWLADTLEFRPEFTDRLARRFGAETRRADFGSRPEPARKEINGWVSDQTGGHLGAIFPPGSIDSATRLVLASAVWFQGKWEEDFDPDDTRKEPFHLAGGGTVETDLMHQTEHFAYGEVDGVQLLDLGYRGGRLGMLVLLPGTPDGLPALERRLDADWLRKQAGAMGRAEVVVTLPRFSIRWGADLGPPLRALGLDRAFSPDRADLSGMADAEGLYLLAMRHEAWVEVDEVGTRAAAATGMVIGAEISDGGPKVFRADRPFLFLIRDRPTGTVLFLGRFTRPDGRE